MKQVTKNIIKNSLKRIFLYRACLVRLKLMGVEKVFSYTLANETGVTSDQVRKDFSEFDIKGISGVDITLMNYSKRWKSYSIGTKTIILC